MHQHSGLSFTESHRFAAHRLHGIGMEFAILCFLVTISLPGSVITQAVPFGDRFSFYAVYDRVADMDSLEMNQIQNSVMSADGQSVAVYGRSHITGKIALYTLNIDGSNVQSIPLPTALDNIWDAAISRDGARIFLRHHWEKAIFKVEGGKVLKIFDADGFTEVGGCDQIQTTADGEWVYFRDPNQGICRLSHLGGEPQHIIHDRDIVRDGGRAGNIVQFRISADGKVVAFIINGYWDDRRVFHEKHEVFALAEGGVRQLTNSERHIYKSHLAISGDGQVIAYTALAPQNRIWIVHADGSGSHSLDPIVDAGDIVLNEDGSKLVYYDTGANGGRLLYTDGSRSVDLFPLYNVRAIALRAPQSLAVNDDGTRISFRFQDGVYAGYLDPADTVPGAPVIHEIWFEPAVTGIETLRDSITLYAKISDPDGLDDITRTITNELIADHTEGNYQKVPIRFYSPVNDAGTPPDRVARDGVFSSASSAGGAPDAIPDARIRVAVMDSSYTVVVADAGLSAVADTAAIAESESPLLPSEPMEMTPQRPLSAEQQRILQRYGPPDAFEISHEPYDDDPEKMVICESWRYFDYLTSFEFIDGELLDSIRIEAAPDNTLAASQYSPEGFRIGMDLGDVKILLGDAELAQADLPERFGEKLEIYTGDQILLGFADGVLEYVVTFALTVGEEEEL